MKTVRTILLFIVILLGMSTIVMADSGVKIKVDGVLLQDAEAVLQNGSTLLPVRSVGNALGGNVTWDNATKTVFVEKGDTTVIAPIGEKFILINDETKPINISPQILDGKTYIPLRVVGEALSCDIVWINETKTVEISNNESMTISPKEDIFGGEKTEISFVIPEEIYLGVNEVAFIPFEDQIGWSTNGAFTGIYASYNGQDGVKIIGLKEGSGQLNFGEKKVKLNIVNESSATYLSKNKKSNTVNIQVIGNHSELINREEQVKEKYGLELNTFDFMNQVYMTKDNVLVIPIEATSELTGVFEFYSSSGTSVSGEIQAVLDEYNGKPAFFIKGIKDGVVDVFVRYIHDNSDTLRFKFEERMTTDLSWHREKFSSDPKNSDLDTTVWAFEINIVNDNNRNYKTQEKLRQENGISYDLYLLGLA